LSFAALNEATVINSKPTTITIRLGKISAPLSNAPTPPYTVNNPTIKKAIDTFMLAPDCYSVVPRERLELSILSAMASKTIVYTIPPPGQ
jgi:hypothetical protein